MSWGALGLGLLGGAVVGGLLGGGGGGSNFTQGSSGQTQTTTTTNINRQENDPATQRMLDTLSDRSIAAADLPYIYYNQPRVAGFSPDQEAAHGAIRDFASDPAYGNYNRTALDTLAGVRSENWPEADRGAYMNPYVEDVLNRITERLEQQRRQTVRRIGDEASKAGAFGGTRQGVMEANAEAEFYNTLADTTAKGYSSAYDTGLKAWQADRDARINAELKSGQSLAQTVNLAQTSDLSRIAALEGIGAQEQNLEQRGLDVAYQNFYEARDWPRQQVELLAGAARSAPRTTTTTGTNTVTGTGSSTTSPPLLSQLAGLATSGLAAYKLFT